MTNTSRIFLFLLAPLVLTATGCVHAPPPPMAIYASGDHETALAAQSQLAAVPGIDQALENCRLASMAIAMGNDRLAETALRRAVGIMQSFQAEGEWRAMMGAESSKEWKGEPYEKLMAFLYLGILLYEKGDYGNALAMFKSAVLADTGTVEERYRSDFIPAFLMQAMAYSAVHEPPNAQQAMTRAVDSLYSRAVVDMLSTAILDIVVPGGSPTANRAAKAALLSGLPAGVSVHPREPILAIEATLSQATDILHLQLDRPRRDRLPSLRGFTTSQLESAFDVMEPISVQWIARAREIPTKALDIPQHDVLALQALLDDPPPVILLVEQGRGPHKISEGRYDEILRIVPSGPDPGPPRVSLDATPLDAIQLDSITYQATTRGGRKVDAFLKGKAVFKDSTMITGFTLLQLGDIADMADADGAATALRVAGLASMLVSAATNPAADTREWALIPEGIWLVPVRSPPGKHHLQINDRTYTLDVPTRGSSLCLIPRLAPGGASSIPSH